MYDNKEAYNDMRNDYRLFKRLKNEANNARNGGDKNEMEQK